MFSIHIDTARTWRGGQNQALLTVLGLRSLGHRTVLVCHPAGELRRRARESTDIIALAPRTEVDLSAAWRLTRIIRQERPDVVHAHDPHGVAMAATALSLGRFDPDPIFVASRRVDFRLGRNAFSRWKYRRVDAFFCASEAIRQMVIEDGVDEQIAMTVHEGIDLDHVDAAPILDVHAEHWLPHDAPIVCNVGALVPHKGQRYLIEAIPQVLRRVPDTRVIVLGEGELRPTLERTVRELRIEKHVLLPGFRPDVLSLLKAATLFVMSSVTEGLGTSVLDAMACRKAVIGTRAGGIPEMVVDGETGLLVPVRDAGALTEAIVALLQDPQRRERFGNAGRQQVEARFTAEWMVEQTLQAYGRVADRTRAGDTTGRRVRG